MMSHVGKVFAMFVVMMSGFALPVQGAQPRTAASRYREIMARASSIPQTQGQLAANLPARVRERLNRSRRPQGRPGLDDGEFMLDTTRTRSAPLFSPNGSAAASNGTDYCVVWSPGWPSSIYGARTTAQGQLLDSSPIIVSDWHNTSPGWMNDYPDIASDGTNYFAVWNRMLWDSIGNFEQALYGARVSPGGVVLDPDGIRLTGAMPPGGSCVPAVVFGSTDYLVVWDDGSYGLYGTRVTPAGIVLDPDGFAIANDPSVFRYARDAAFDGSNYLAVWTRDSEYVRIGMCAARVTPAGVVLDSAGIALAQDTLPRYVCGAAFNGTDYLIVSYFGEYGVIDVLGTRLTPAGVLRDTTPFTICGATGDQMTGSIASDGANCLVTWTDYRLMTDIRAARVTPAGTVLDPDGIIVDSSGYGGGTLPVAANGTNYLVAWGGADGMRVARVAPTGVVLDPAGFNITFGVNRQYRPAAASDGTDYLAAWLDGRHGDYYDIYATRVSASGQVLDQPALLVARVSEPGWIPPVAVGFGGGNYLAVFCDFSNSEADLYCARVTPAGQVLDSVPIPVCTETDWQMLPFIVFDGTNFLVTWSDFRDDPSYPDVYAARITTAGIVLDPGGFPVVTGPGSQGWSSTAFDGTNSLVTWIDDRNGDDDIYAARVTPGGIVLDSGGFPVAVRPFDQDYPTVGFDGANYFVAWQDYSTDTVYYHFFGVCGARVTPGGTVLDTVARTVFVGEMRRAEIPFLRFDGVNHVIVWQYFDYMPYLAQGIRGVRVNPAGTVVDSFLVADMQFHDNLGYMSAAVAQDRKILVTYHDQVGEFQGVRYFTNRVIGKLGPFGGVAEQADRTLDRAARLAVFPNPCRGRATIRYTPGLGQGRTMLQVFDPTGRQVRAFAVTDMITSPGNRRSGSAPLLLDWNGTDERGRRLAPGVYFIRTCPERGASETRSLLLLN
jgi:hypothetical protein